LLNDEWIWITGGMTDRKSAEELKEGLFQYHCVYYRSHMPREIIPLCNEKPTAKPLSYGVALCILLSLVCPVLLPPHDALWGCGWRRPADMLVWLRMCSMSSTGWPKMTLLRLRTCGVARKFSP
jgi:hypothetical protein